MSRAELRLPEEPKKVRMYDVSKDQMVDGWDKGWLIAVIETQVNSVPCVPIKGTDLFLIAIREELPIEEQQHAGT